MLSVSHCMKIKYEELPKTRKIVVFLWLIERNTLFVTTENVNCWCSPMFTTSTLTKSSQVIFHMKSGVTVLPRLPRLLELKAEPEEACSVNRLKRSIENTFSWQQANSSWKKSPKKKTIISQESLNENPGKLWSPSRHNTWHLLTSIKTTWQSTSKE